MPCPCRFSGRMAKVKTGIVYLIGAGPGDPGLITVKGRDCLRRADVVVYDYLANPAFLRELPEHAERIYVGKKAGNHHRPQEKINELLIAEAREGKVVVRLKGGDPYIFGRGGEEALCLQQAGIPFEVVPGVTSGFAAGAYAGIPLTHRDYTTSLGLVTGHENPEKKMSSLDWEKLATGLGTLVFYMGMANLALISKQLIAHGRPASTPVAVIRWATTPRQQTLVATLGDVVEKVAEAQIKPPAIIVVGEVVSLREELRWFDKRPLFGKRILVTRTTEQTGAFSALLEEQGAEAIACPVIEIVPPQSWEELDAEIARLGETDYLVLTSANAVKAFFGRLQAAQLDARALHGTSVVAVGPKTTIGLGLGKRLAAKGDAFVEHDRSDLLFRESPLKSRHLPKSTNRLGERSVGCLREVGGAECNPFSVCGTLPAREACEYCAACEHLPGATATIGAVARCTSNVVDLLPHRKEVDDIHAVRCSIAIHGNAAHRVDGELAGHAAIGPVRGSHQVQHGDRRDDHEGSRQPSWKA